MVSILVEIGCYSTDRIMFLNLGHSKPAISSHFNKHTSPFCGDSRLFPSSLNCLLKDKVGHNERRVQVPLFTIIQFAIEIGRGSKITKDHTRYS